MSWITRTAIGVATITLHVKQYKEADDVTRIDISQTLTGGISGTSEKRTLNWGVNDHTDHIFGHVNGQTRFFKAAEVAGKTRPDLEMQTKIGKDSDDQLALRFLRGEILGDGSECEGFVVEGENGDSFIQSWVKSVDNGWTAEQVRTTLLSIYFFLVICANDWAIDLGIRKCRRQETLYPPCRSCKERHLQDGQISL